MPETNFFWDPLSDNILQERDETGAVTAAYTTEPGLYGNLISQNRSGVESQYHFDALGSTLSLTDDDQQVADTYGSTAFGELTERTGNTLTPFQYRGQQGFVTAGDVIYLRGSGNMYQPTLGRSCCARPYYATESAYGLFSHGLQVAADIVTAPFDEQQGDDCLPLVKPPPTTPMPKCAVSLHGKTSGEDKTFCRAISGYGSTFCGVCNKDDILAHVGKTRCCNLLIDGHRGGASNTGGVSNYLCSRTVYSLQRCGYYSTSQVITCPRDRGCWYRDEQCTILPDPSLGTQLGWIMQARCRDCVITVRGCESGEFAGPLLELAEQSGCFVCGYKSRSPISDPPQDDPLRSAGWVRCVSPRGEQVGNPGMPRRERFCDGNKNKGDPATPGRARVCV